MNNIYITTAEAARGGHGRGQPRAGVRWLRRGQSPPANPSSPPPTAAAPRERPSAPPPVVDDAAKKMHLLQLEETKLNCSFHQCLQGLHFQHDYSRGQ